MSFSVCPLRIFLSTPSARRATTRTLAAVGLDRYFYPRPPRGGRRVHQTTAGGRKNISIHALREEGDPAGQRRRQSRPISIHALREEGDVCVCVCVCDFYPRPPRGGRHDETFIPYEGSEFLSTPSARRATANTITRNITGRYFYPRPPRGGRRPFLTCCHVIRDISIHALREEGDLLPFRVCDSCILFLSTPSARRATGAPVSCFAVFTLFLSTPSARRATSLLPFIVT